MKHTFKASTIKRIIFEEIQRAHLREKEEVKAAADEIVRELEKTLNEVSEESFIDKIINLISKKSEEKDLDEDELAIQTYKNLSRRGFLKKAATVLALGTALGIPSAVIQGELSAQSAARAEASAEYEAEIQAQKQMSSDAISQLDSKLKIPSNFMWSLSKEATGTMKDFAKSAGSLQNYPMFLDYYGGPTQMFSQEYGVIVKLKNDIQKQIDQGVTNKKDLKPLIDMETVRDPQFSKSEYASKYKQLYNIPEFDPTKTSEDDIGGNQERVSKASKNKIQFLRGKGRSFGYESYELLDFVNPELPNERMSPSQYYVKLFNEVTGQNI